MHFLKENVNFVYIKCIYYLVCNNGKLIRKQLLGEALDNLEFLEFENYCRNLLKR